MTTRKPVYEVGQEMPTQIQHDKAGKWRECIQNLETENTQQTETEDD